MKPGFGCLQHQRFTAIKVECRTERYIIRTFSLTASDTVLDSMRHETVQARMWNKVYMTRVLEDDLMGGQKEQHSEQGAGPQQQHICPKNKDKLIE